MGKPSYKWLALGLAFVAAIALTFVFGYRAGRHARHIRWESEPIRPWMNVPFIAHTHHVPPEILFQALGIPAQAHDRRPIGRIARQQGKPVSELIRGLEGALIKAGHIHAGNGDAGRGP